MRSSLSFLRDAQQLDGSFVALSGVLTTQFEPLRPQPTAFHTMLIATCLQGIQGTEDICAAASRYVARQQNPDGSWNYWNPDSEARRSQPYPDDLDDTACALALLSRSVMASVEQLGAFARLLVTAERTTGGPYNSWLTDLADWSDFDVAVNANIGYALNLHGVTPTGLRAFIERAITNDTYSSSYYVGELPVLYFISRWYRGEQQPRLRHKIKTLLDTDAAATPLAMALLISSAGYQGVTHDRIPAYRRQLLACMQRGHWPAEPLYVDVVYDGVQYYAGSAEVTTAFVIEALARPEALPKPPIRRRRLSLSAVYQDTASIPSSSMRKRYHRVAQAVLQSEHGVQVGQAASLLMAETDWQVNRATVARLNTASLHGWVAYSLYDDVLDGSLGVERICLANMALRRSFEAYMQVSQTPGLDALVRTVFDTMDVANDWELCHARARRTSAGLTTAKLPDYGDLGQLAERSWGHSLVAVCLATIQYGSVDHPAVDGLQRFFRHFLIARQLNDDAHDWAEDLAAGQLSVVVVRLLREAGMSRSKFLVDRVMPELRLVYWNKTIDWVVSTIENQLAAAHVALIRLEPYMGTDTMRQWLSDLQAATTAAQTGRNDARQFIHAYESRHV